MTIREAAVEQAEYTIAALVAKRNAVLARRTATAAETRDHGFAAHAENHGPSQSA